VSKTYVIAGISTEVGKTIVSAIVVEALSADYWKPIQSGSLTDSDTDVVRGLISNSQSTFHKEAYRLNEPLSPHAAAKADGVQIDPTQIQVPNVDNSLIIELAGGLMVPMSANFLNIDLLKKWQYPVILVVNYYLGSINHSLLSIECLRNHDIPIKALSRDVILECSGIDNYIEIPNLPSVEKQEIKVHAERIAKSL